MRNLEIRQYQRGDEELIEPVEEMFRLYRNHPDYKAEWDRQISPERTWTGLCDGVILCLGGVLKNGIVWVILDRNAANKKIAVMRLLREGFGLIKNCNGFITLTTYVKKDVNALEGIFARHFGFEVVAEKKFGDFTYLEYEWRKP